MPHVEIKTKLHLKDHKNLVAATTAFEKFMKDSRMHEKLNSYLNAEKSGLSLGKSPIVTDRRFDWVLDIDAKIVADGEKEEEIGESEDEVVEEEDDDEEEDGDSGEDDDEEGDVLHQTETEFSVIQPKK